MSAALVMVAVALCVAPWRGTAAERLRDLTPIVARRGTAAVRARPWSPVLDRIRPQTSRKADTGTLARMLDLLSVALRAGLPTHLALAAVSDAMSPTEAEVAGPLRAAAARVTLGATPAQAWRDVPGADRLSPVAAVLARATDGGGSVRSALDHAARRMRTEADAAATARAERAAVLVAGPLGLCFLPAFICLGVLPVVVGLADGMLPGVLP